MLPINNLFNFTIVSLFTLAVVFIGIPLSVYLFVKGIEGFVKYRFGKLPKNFLIDSGLGIYSLEITFYGLILFIIAFWYLFLDKEGQLFNFLNGIRFLLTK